MLETAPHGVPAFGTEDSGGTRRHVGVQEKLFPHFQRVFLEPPAQMDVEEREAMLTMRSELELVVDGDAECDFPPLIAFDELASVLPDFLQRALQDSHLDTPLPMQAQSLPLVLAGRSISCVSKTGSGKALTFLISAVVHIEAQEPMTAYTASPIALMLTSTREQAMSISQLAKKLIKGSHTGHHTSGISSACLYDGGVEGNRLQNELLDKGCHILASTPDRLIELVDASKLSLERVTFLALDDVDLLLHACGAQVQKLCACVRPDRQVLLFAAEWTPVVQEFAASFCGDEAVVVHGP